MRHLVKLLAFLVVVLFTASALGQEGQVLFERTISIPRDATFGAETLSRGSYRIALTDINGEKWFIISKGETEVARDVALELPVTELPTQGMKAEILRGEEYYRVRVRQADKVYLLHFLLRS